MEYQICTLIDSLREALENRDPEGILCLVSPDCTWSGLNYEGRLRGTEQIRQKLEERFLAASKAYVIEVSAQEDQALSPLIHQVSMQLDAYQKQVRARISTAMLSAVITREAEGAPWKIRTLHSNLVHVHTSDPFDGEKEFALERARKQLLSSTPLGGVLTFYYEPGFPLCQVDDEIVRQLGYESEQELAAATFGRLMTLIHPEDSRRVEEEIRQQVRENRRYRIVYRIRKKSGGYIWFEELGVVVPNTYGRLVAVGACRDVTREREQNKLLSTIANHMPGALAVYEFDGADFSLSYLSEGWGPLTGYATQEYMALCQQKIYPGALEEERAGLIEEVKRLGRERQACSITHRMRRKDGRVIWLNFQADFAEDRTCYGVFQDITESMERKQELKAANTRYSSLLETIPGGLCVYRIKGGQLELEYINHGAAAFAGCPIGELCQLARHTPIGFVAEEDRTPFTKMVQEVMERHVTRSLVCRALRRDGTQKWMTVLATASEEQDGVSYVYATFVDISEQKQAEQTLRESEALYRMATVATGLSVWEYDVASQTIAFPKDLGGLALSTVTTLDELMGILPLTEKGREAMDRMMKRVLTGETLITEELWIHRENEQNRCIQVTCSVAMDPQGNPRHVYGATRDITSQKRLEIAFRKEADFRQELEKTTVASYKLNLTHNQILEGSCSIPSMDGRIASKTVDGFLRLSARAILDPVARKEMENRFACRQLVRLYEGGQRSATGEYKYFNRYTNDVFWLSVSVYLARDPITDEILGYLYCTDITAQKLLEAVGHKLSKQQYEMLSCVNIAQGRFALAISEMHESRGIHITGSYDEKILAFVRRFVEPRRQSWYLQQLALKSICEKLENRPKYEMVCVACLPSGGERSIMLSYSYLDDSRKMLLLTAADITQLIHEERARSEQLTLALDAAKRASYAKSLFLAKMSHELRTPLNAITGSAALVRDQYEDRALVQELASNNISASKYLLTLIDDLLDLTKVENDTLILRKEQVNWKTLLHELNDMIGPQADRTGVHYTVCDRMGDHCGYRADPIRMKQIIINLLNNAVKFTPAGGTVTFTAEILCREKGREKLRWTVEDTGVGIRPENLELIFQPFEQEHEGPTTSYVGAGLGLPIARKLARMMDGDLTVESTVGMGTRFIAEIWLDLAENCGETPRAKEKTERRDFSGKRLLLVEDHPMNVLVERRLLSSRGFRVDTAENGKEGVEQFQRAGEGYYDVVLMDIRMPMMDGLEAASRIRSLGSAYAKQVPILATTANAYPEDVEKALEAGMNGHLPKPIEPEVLFETLWRYLAVQCPAEEPDCAQGRAEKNGGDGCGAADETQTNL